MAALAATWGVVSIWMLGRGSSSSSRATPANTGGSPAETLIHPATPSAPVEVVSTILEIPEGSGEPEKRWQRCCSHRLGLEKSLVWTSWLLQSAQLELELEERRMHSRFR